MKEEAPPPLYQSPQFQNEFPSLDGQVPVNAANKTGGYQNTSEAGEKINLRPQTDSQNWLAQQNAGGARGAAVEDGVGYQTDQDLLGSQKYIALMPSFMLRGQGQMAPPQHNTGSTAAQSNNRDAAPSGNYHGREQTHHAQNNGNYQGRPRQERGGYQGQGYNDQYGRRPPPRHQRNEERGSSYEQVEYIFGFILCKLYLTK